MPDIIVEPAEIRRYVQRDRIREEDLEVTAGGQFTDDNQLYEALNVLKVYQLLGNESP